MQKSSEKNPCYGEVETDAGCIVARCSQFNGIIGAVVIASERGGV